MKHQIMQIIKPKTLGIIHKAYRLKHHQLAVGALAFFPLKGDNKALLVEYEQWANVMAQLPMMEPLDTGFAKPKSEVLMCANRYFHQHGLLYKSKPGVEVSGMKHRLSFSRLSGQHPQKQLSAFMPVAITKKQRSRYNGTYNKGWLDNVHPGFPDDTDPRLFNCAPIKQQKKPGLLQSAYFSPNDYYCLTDVDPEQKVIEGHLPDINVRIFVNMPEMERVTQLRLDEYEPVIHEIETHLETVWFFPEVNLGISLYRGVIPVNDSDGLDVKHLLLAYENNQDEARPQSYYHQVFSQRTHPDTALAHVFNESQLCPDKTAAEIQAMAALVSEEQQQQAQHVATMRQQYLQQAQQTVEQSLPDNAPGASEINGALVSHSETTKDNFTIPTPSAAALKSGDFDLTEMIAATQKLNERLQQQMQAKQSELQAMAEDYQEQYDDERPVQQESLEEIQQRLNNSVYVTATELKAEQKIQGNNPIAQALEQIPDSIKSQANDDSLDEEALSTAYDALLTTQRQARQSAPMLTRSFCIDVSVQAKVKAWVVEQLTHRHALSGRDLSGFDLSGIDFSGTDLRDVMFEACDLSYCDFTQCQLGGAVFIGSQLQYTCFDHAMLCRANFSQSQGEGVSFRAAKLDDVLFVKAYLHEVDFSDASGNQMNASEANFSHGKFSGITIENGQFGSAVLNHTQWLGANVMASFFLKAELQHSQWQQAILERCIMIDILAKHSVFSQATLEKVQFSDTADLQGAVFQRAYCHTSGFRGINLEEVNARDAIFIDCDFGDTHLVKAQLQGAIFKHSLLTLTNLANSDCEQALFSEAVIRKVNFSHCYLYKTEFYHCTLDENQFEHSRQKKVAVKPQKALK